MKKKQEPLIDRLHTESRILRAATALVDGRSVQARNYRRLADLLDEAVMFMAGVRFGTQRKQQKRGR